MGLHHFFVWLVAHLPTALRAYFEVWSTRKMPDEYIILGHPVFFWARVGKATQLVSGSVILVNIIGVEKIRDAGEWVGGLLTWKTVFSIPKVVDRRLKVLLLDMQIYATHEEPMYIVTSTSRFGNERELNPKYSFEANAAIRKDIENMKEERRALSGYKGITYLIYIPGILAIIGSGWLLNRLFEWSGKWVIWFMTSPIVFFGASFLAVFLVGVIFRIPLLLCDLLIIRPIAYLLSLKELERFALKVSFLLLIVGSLMDIAFS